MTLLIAGFSFPGVKAQDDVSKKKELSIGVQGAFNPNKTGVGARFGFDFNERLRFTVDGTYYLTAKKTMDVFQGEKITRTLNDGRLWDGNINLNFVYGRKNFHFYIIGGIGIAYGYKFGVASELMGAGAYSHYDANDNYLGVGIDEANVIDVTRFGVSLNSGFGIEWQITPALRWNLEPTLNIGIPSLTTWMCKSGVAFCF